MAQHDAGGDPRSIDLRLDRAHSARMYDYYLRGKTNYAADRAAAEKVAETWPSVFVCAKENRSFLHRVTRVLAEDLGIRQWLDIGTGIPTSPNLHEVAQEIAPEARVVYVDNDPIVLTHARALLTSSPEGRTAYIQADATDPEAILGSGELADTLDLRRPVALSLNALLHFLPDSTDPYGTVDRLMGALPSGSTLAITHCTADFDPGTWGDIQAIYAAAGTATQVRSRSEVERFFSGLEMLEPGVEVAHRWRPVADGGHSSPEPVEALSDSEVSLWVGVGVKP
ncbi:SAM-dependent methyltransferase [Streptomyces sp. TP-A0874]|uniref:SAM-dependent methyltransferase n=1 Tax=Streptomyces sp. TP-A0874 TaxID=549819 RepID=UPI000853538B|nr:SAM-dependent methyltransferase [Streptomyces sp. TP-A0874]